MSHLATGAMTDLYIARQEAVGGFEKKLVIKALQARHARQPDLVRRFLDEARLAAKLNHPSIVHVYDVGDAKGKKFIAMEYIQGGTLADVIRRGVEVGKFLPIEHALHIVGQVAAGLDYAHRRRDPRGEALRIVHGNVSLSNIMMSNEGQAKLIAFGSALVRAQIPQDSQIHPAEARYLSPEQVAGEAIDHRSDIYSLGIVLYETTVAQPLWRGPTEEIVKRITAEPIQPPTSVRHDYPRALELIVMKALEKRPADRYQSADQLRSDLEDYVAASGARSGAHLVALYLRDLFPATAAFSDGGIGPAPSGETELPRLPMPKGAEAFASDGARSSTSMAFRRLSFRRGASTVKWAMMVAIPALTALTALAFVGRPVRRNAVPAPPLSEAAPSVRRHRQPVVSLPAALVSGSQPAKPSAMVVVAMPPPATLRRVTVGGDRDRARRQRPRGAPVAVSAPSTAPAEAPPALPPQAPPPAPRRLSARFEESPVTRAAAPARSPRSVQVSDPPAPPPPAAVDSRAVAAVVHDHAIEVQACFDRSLMEQPDLRGRFSVRATIDADGRVLDLTTFGAAMAGGGRLQECVMRAFRRWTFPPPPAGRRTSSITYAFKFD